MEICLIVTFLLILVFLFRFTVLKKIKDDNRYREPPNDKYIAIPSIKIVNAACLFLAVLCLFLGLFLFELLHASPKRNDQIAWYFMFAFSFLSGSYYAVMLHTQYFYFYFGKDYIEFNLEIGKHSKDAITISLEEIGNIVQDTKEYRIVLKNQGHYRVNIKKIEGLVGSELLKKKLAHPL